jgi:thiamine-monophosphate kinase
MNQAELIQLFLQPFPDEIREWQVNAAGQDDCAVLNVGDEFLIVSTDRANSSPLAFELGFEEYRALGRYVVSANISDILGSGGSPLGLLINISIPDDFNHSLLREIAEGIQQYTSEYGCPLIGGDTKRDEALVVSGTGIGKADQRSQLRPRDGARPGDWIVVSGDVGNCYASAVAHSVLDESKYNQAFVRDSILDPGLPYEENEKLRQCGLGKGGIDISDGLGGDLMKLANQSNVGLEIQANQLPIHKEVRNIAQEAGYDSTEFTFGFGGDWEFIATVDQSRLNELPDGVHVIGQATDAEEYHLIKNERKEKLPRFAYDDFDHLSFIKSIRE